MKPTAASIIAEHADRYGVTLAEFLAPSKARPLAHARQDAMADVRRRPT